MNIELGAINSLVVVKEVDFGLYLDGGEAGEILLPNNSVPENYTIGEELDVFIYNDSEDRLIATTNTPFAMVGDVAYLEVVAVNAVGAFLDWGLVKDLFVPFREQKQPMKVGERHLVMLYIDGQTDRIVGTAKLDGFFNLFQPEYAEGDEVDLIIYHRTDLGYKVIINMTHLGLIYENTVFKKLTPGDTLTGYIKKVREDELIDVVLYKPGMAAVDDQAKQILDKLEQAGGKLAVSDKSTPELIYDTFGISKKMFKKTIGGLYKQKLIALSDEGITLL